MKKRQLFKATQREIADDILHKLYHSENPIVTQVQNNVDTKFEFELLMSKRNILDTYWEQFVHMTKVEDIISWSALAIDVLESIIEECFGLNAALTQAFEFELNRWKKINTAATSKR